MTPIPSTPLAELDTLDLLREYDARLAEPQTLGVRTRVAAIEAEIRNRATTVNLTEWERRHTAAYQTNNNARSLRPQRPGHDPQELTP